MNLETKDTNRKPIGVFDSGVGGLTVASAIRRRAPRESILYFGDTARVPYGTKSTETIRRYTREIARFLDDRGVKMVVAACNSCSATALDCVGGEFEGPVLGVIEPGVEAALAATVNGRIGVIGTQATISSGAYEHSLREKKPEIHVVSTACPLLVPLAEEHLENHEATRLLTRSYLQPLLDDGIDTLILGCTHYPLLSEVIREVAGAGVNVVDSADSTAQSVEAALRNYGLSAPDDLEPTFRYFASDDPSGLEKMHRRLLGDAPVWVGIARLG